MLKENYMERLRRVKPGSWLRFSKAIYLGCAIMLSLCACQKKESTQQTQLSSSFIIADSLPWSVRMAESEIYRQDDSLVYSPAYPKGNWNYQTGLFLKALLDLQQAFGGGGGDTHYYNYVKRVVDSYVLEDGSIKTYQLEDYNIDNINSGKVLLTLYKTSHEDKYRKAAFLIRKQLSEQPRTKSGGFWHKKIYPWQIWLDGIYMEAPFYLEFSKMFDQPAGYEDVINQILLIDVHTRDPRTGLRYHGWDESNGQKWADPVTGCSPGFWGRAMGWYSMALVDILDYLPADFPRREQIVFILNDLNKAIMKYQDKKTGLWYQVLDQGDRTGNYHEASASAMFVYTLAKSAQMNYSDSTCWQAALKGYRGIIDNLVSVTPNGLVNLNQVCSVAGLGGNPYRDGTYGYYISEPVVSNDLKGVGPFILAAMQMEKAK
jgi:unsaturated rhamnogalacturonyl hydrolase